MTPVSRREFLAAAGATGTALVAPRFAAAAPVDDPIQAEIVKRHAEGVQRQEQLVVRNR